MHQDISVYKLARSSVEIVMTIYHHETLSVNKKYERIKTAPMKEEFPEMSRGNFYGVAILKCDVKLLLGVSTLLFKSFKSLTFETVLTTVRLNFRDYRTGIGGIII